MELMKFVRIKNVRNIKFRIKASNFTYEKNAKFKNKKALNF